VIVQFSELKNGDLFMCSGTEYVKISKCQAIAISTIIHHFPPDSQVAQSTKEVTTVGNWRWSAHKKARDVHGA